MPTWPYFVREHLPQSLPHVTADRRGAAFLKKSKSIRATRKRM